MYIELNLYSVWHELRWGITGCMILTVSLITLIFYYHPTTTNVSKFFRTVTVLSEGSGRVSEVLVENNQKVQAGDKLFQLDDSKQRASLFAAQLKIAEVEAAMVVAVSELAASEGAIVQAQGAFNQTDEDLGRKRSLKEQGSSAVRQTDIDALENELEGRIGALAGARANRDAVNSKIGVLLPAQRESALAAVKQAEVGLSKTTITAGISGTLVQFVLKPGDIVNPILRPAGILVPADPGSGLFEAGFGQLAAPVIKLGMIAEISCLSKPFTIIPMVIVEIQDTIAAGQIRATDQLLDLQDRARPGTITVYMKPLYEGQADDIPPGSKCFANAYTDNHELLQSDDLGFWEGLFLHMVDAVGVAHAMIMRIQVLVLPVKNLVFSGH